MKYHSIFTPALTSLCLLTTTASLAADSTALPVEDPARWFEIEIILFKHLSTKEQNKEEFTSSDLTARKRYALDLLAPYLQPDIASLKQLLPSCGQPNANFPYDIESIPFSLETNENDENSDDTGNIVNKSEQNVEPAIIARNEESTNTASMLVSELASTAHIKEIEHSSSSQTAISDEPAVQSEYIEIVLPNYSQYPSDSQTPLCIIPAEFFEQHLNPEQLAQFSIDGFPVEKLTTTIDGIEQWRADENDEITWASDKPYLISKNSLRLKTIANSIKRSRNYAPLLHIGWRQIGESRRQAQAVNLYAGENLNLDYQQALEKQAEQQTALAIKAILEKRQQTEALIIKQQLMDNDIANSSISDNNPIETYNIHKSNASELKSGDNIDITATLVKELSIEEELLQQAKQQQLDKLFQQFALLNESNNKVTSTDISNDELATPHSNKTLIDEEEVKSIVAQLSADISKPVSPLFDNTNESNALAKLIAVTAPLQPWSIDGLLKVYLHQNRYLNINSEFNIIESLTNVASTQKNNPADTTSSQAQVISFKQDRRLISGEIHYFDHPYIGMVVQIRRFDPTKPADEAVTQAKK